MKSSSRKKIFCRNEISSAKPVFIQHSPFEDALVVFMVFFTCTITVDSEVKIQTVYHISCVYMYRYIYTHTIYIYVYMQLTFSKILRKISSLLMLIHKRYVVKILKLYNHITF